MAAVALLALALGAWSTTDAQLASANDPAPTIVPPRPVVALAPTTVTTSAPPTTVNLPKPPLPGLGRGSKGPDVLALEQRLEDLRYDVGKVDGNFDSTTYHAVIAFQKVQGLARTGRATDDVVNVLETVGTPGTMLPSAEPSRIEVDLKRQVLFLIRDRAVFKILTISTGSGKKYCVDGECAHAVTPGGSFRVTRRIPGWRTSRLGKLFNPLYFNGGIAIHGAPSVPAYPASHGCVRITMGAAQWFPGAVANGTPVYVLGGPRAPVPFNEQAPTDTPPSTTSTTAGSTSSSTTSTTTPLPTTSSTSTTVPAPVSTTTTQP